MATLHTDALILRSVELGESDRILHLLVPEHGRLTAIAKGARRSVKRFGGTLDLFNLLRVHVERRRRGSMSRLEQAVLVRHFPALRHDPVRYALGCYLLELLGRLAPEGGSPRDMRRLFAFAVGALELLESQRPGRALQTVLELRALDALGLRPELRRCVGCGREIREPGPVAFHIADGGPACEAGAVQRAGLVPVHLGTLRALEQALRLDVARLDRLVLPAAALDEARRLVGRFQRFHLGIALRSGPVLEHILSGPGTLSETPLYSAPSRLPRPRRARSAPDAGEVEPTPPRRTVGAMSSEQPAKRRRLERMEDLVSLCARRGFVFPSSEIYGGINGFWDYGPLGAELKQNLKARWWQRVVRERPDVEGIDSAIIAHPRTWEASGHVEHFSDPMVDCRACKKRFRADQTDDAGRCSATNDGAHELTEPRSFNLMLKTWIGASEDAASLAYLRAETCQPVFTDMKRVREAARQKIPFGIAQIGKAFRNEINPRNFTFRSREFEQAELEYFVHPSEREKWFEHWLEQRLAFHRELGFDAEHLRTRPHEADELAHYARAAVDVEYRFPFGWQEIEGIHDRGDWDLSRHGQYSGKDLGITDPDTKEHFVPMVIETSVGIDRTCLALLVDAYTEEELPGGDQRLVMRFPPALAPVQAAVLPLSKKLAEPAHKLEAELRRRYNIFYDEAGNIGRRYRRQDEAGTPFCVTIDFDSAEDGKATVRERDSMRQERVALEAVAAYLAEHLERSA